MASLDICPPARQQTALQAWRREGDRDPSSHAHRVALCTVAPLSMGRRIRDSTEEKGKGPRKSFELGP